MKRYLTSESSEGHPDKLCDYIADSVLDACLKGSQLKGGMRGARTKARSSAGEITCNSRINIQRW